MDGVDTQNNSSHGKRSQTFTIILSLYKGNRFFRNLSYKSTSYY